MLNDRLQCPLRNISNSIIIHGTPKKRKSGAWTMLGNQGNKLHQLGLRDFLNK